MSVTAGARGSGGGEAQGGGTEEEVCGEGEADPQPAREPERAADTAAAAGEWLSCPQPPQNGAIKLMNLNMFICFKKFSSFFSVCQNIHKLAETSHSQTCTSLR